MKKRLLLLITTLLAIGSNAINAQISPAYYVIGAAAGWSAAGARCQKFSHSDADVYKDPIFTIIVNTGGDDCWFAIGDDAAIDAVEAGDWNQLFGTMGASEDLTGTMDRRYNLDGDHSFHVTGAQRLRITINMKEYSYKIEPVDVAQDALFANDVSIEAGKTASLQIGLKNELAYTIATFDIMLPKGINIVYDAESDDYAITLSRWSKSHRATVSPINGGYRILIMDSSNKNKTIGAGEGTMATITLQASAEAKSGIGKIVADGEYNGTKKQVFATPDGSQYFLKDVSFKVDVKKEATPITYNLSIKATGNGSASYNGTTIRSNTSSFKVNEGSNATINFTPDNGYQIKTVKVNNSAVTFNNNQYTVNNINKDTSVEVEFEANNQGFTDHLYINDVNIEAGKTATLQIGLKNELAYTIATFDVMLPEGISIVYDEGSDEYAVELSRWSKKHTATVSPIKGGYRILIMDSSNKNKTIEVGEGTMVTITLQATSNAKSGTGKVVADGKANGTMKQVFATPDGVQYFLKDVEFEVNVKTNGDVVKAFTSNGVSYSVVLYDNKTVNVASADYGVVLDVPEKTTYQDMDWKVVGIEKGALANCRDLAAIVWNPQVAFTESVSNPNLLLYVQSKNYAPASITNVIVNGTADRITLMDASQGNNFYCPQEFTAKEANYSHRYSMATGIGESRGWESIALPFDVQKISHSTKGEIVPFAKWNSGDTKKPFWLMEMEAGGFTDADAIKANTPYIISMPNHTNYKSEYRLNGNVTFSSKNVKVMKSDNLHNANYGDWTFAPNFSAQENTGVYALNVNNDYVTYTGSLKEGSSFVANLRAVHPFEAYITSVSGSRQSFDIDDNVTTGIIDAVICDTEKVIRVYNINGQLMLIEENKSLDDVKLMLSAGVYIINGKKQIIR